MTGRAPRLQPYSTHLAPQRPSSLSTGEGAPTRASASAAKRSASDRADRQHTALNTAAGDYHKQRRESSGTPRETYKEVLAS